MARRDEVLLSSQDVAAAVGVSLNTFKRRWRQCVQAKNTYGQTTALKFTLAAVADIVRAMMLEAVSGGDGTAERPRGAEATSLEQLRQMRVQQEQIKLGVMRRDYVPVAAIREPLDEGARILRVAGEKLDRMHGPEAGDVFREALDDWLAAVRRAALERVDGDDGDADDANDLA